MIISKLKEIRERHHLSQTEMGDILHLSQSAYQRLEANANENLHKNQIVLLIQHFGEGAKDLLDTDGIEIVIKENSINNGNLNGQVQTLNYYGIPKEVVDTLIAQLNNVQNTNKQILQTLNTNS